LLGATSFSSALYGSIAVTGVTDKSYNYDRVSFTIAADPGSTDVATLDGVSVAVGSAIASQAIGYHDLEVIRTPAGGGVPEILTLQFIILASERGTTEAGLPPWTPHPMVPDSPAAFSGATLSLIAPPRWPVDLDLPLVAKLTGADGEGLRLNGRVVLGGLSGRSFWLRRGWGSRLLPAFGQAGAVALGGSVQGLPGHGQTVVEDNIAWADVAGNLPGDTTWPANSRIHVTETLTVASGNTLTIGAGSIIKLEPGVVIVVNGALQVDGTVAEPVAFVPKAAAQPWGGIELDAATSQVRANGAIFTGAGADPTWFNTHAGYGSHQGQQALFLVSAAGAELHTSDVWMFDLAGQALNSRSGTVVDLQRTLIQRCVTGGELSGTTVSIDRSALMEFPDDTMNFVDGDNDALYLTDGLQSVTRSVIGWTKDDGLDTGGNGGPGTVTTVSGNWFESIFHEGDALSGNRDAPFSNCVFMDCGQGVECGYGPPRAVVNNCLFTGNLVGARFGDNYNWGYTGSVEVRNSLFSGNFYHDVWGYDWLSWSYANATAFNVHDNLLRMPDLLHHPSNSAWTAADGAKLDAFMARPGVEVGIAVLPPAGQSQPGAYAGSFPVRLSSFSSKQVSATWTLYGATGGRSPLASLATGSVTFEPGETLKTVLAPLTTPGSYAKLAIVLSEAFGAVVTGADPWFVASSSLSPYTLVQDQAGNRQVLYWQGAGAMLETSTDLMNWQPLPEAASPMPVTPGIGGGPFFRLRH
jgi:hypothetical protein